MKIIKTINIDSEIWKKLEIIAKKENRNMSNMIEILIKKYINNGGKF